MKYTKVCVILLLGIGLVLANPIEAHAKETIKSILMEKAGAGALLQSDRSYEDYIGYFWAFLGETPLLFL